MTPRHLINDDGTPFDTSELRSIGQLLDGLNDYDRGQYRNQNATAIANHSAPRMLIVSGPGIGLTIGFSNNRMLAFSYRAS